MALDDVPQLDEIDDVLDDLSSPTSLEVYEAMLPYDDGMVSAAVGQLALNGGGGGGGSEPLVVDLTTAQIAELFSSGGVEVVAAQGAGTVIVPYAASFHYLAGDEPFFYDVALRLAFGADEKYPLQTLRVNDLSALFSVIDLAGGGQVLSLLGLAWIQLSGALDTWQIEQGVVENEPLMLTANKDPLATGAILTSGIDHSGADFAPGDTAAWQLNGGVAAAVTVNTVDGGGAVLTYTMTNGGTRFAVGQGTGPMASTSGTGTDFELNVLTTTTLTDGIGRLFLRYDVLELAT